MPEMQKHQSEAADLFVSDHHIQEELGHARCEPNPCALPEIREEQVLPRAIPRASPSQYAGVPGDERIAQIKREIL